MSEAPSRGHFLMSEVRDPTAEDLCGAGREVEGREFGGSHALRHCHCPAPRHASCQLLI